MEFKNYVVDEYCTKSEIMMVLNHCEAVMELRNKDWSKASELRDACLELLANGTYVL